MSGQCRGCGQRQLLIASAQPFAGQVHHGFPARDKGQLFSLSRMGAGDGTQKAACLPRLAAEPVGEEDRLIAQLPAGFSGRGLSDAAGDLRGHVVKGFRRFLRQQRLRLFRQVQVVFFRNGKSLRTGGGIRHRRAAGNHIQRIAQNIAEHDAEYLCRSTGLCEPTALDSGQPLADGIHLHDIGSAGKELICDVLQFPAGDKRLFKQGAAAAGKQKQHRVLCGQPLHQRQSFFGGCKAVVIRHGMTCLITIYTGDSAFYMAVLGHHHAAVHAP